MTVIPDVTAVDVMHAGETLLPLGGVPCTMCGRMCCVARGPAHLAAVYGVPPHRMAGTQRFRPSANFHPGMACAVVVGGAASSKFQADATVTETKANEPTAAVGEDKGPGGTTVTRTALNNLISSDPVGLLAQTEPSSVRTTGPWW